jgi:hypothetical protein
VCSGAKEAAKMIAETRTERMRHIGILQKGARGNYSGCSAAIDLPLPGNRPALYNNFKQFAAVHRREIAAANRSRERRISTDEPPWLQVK